ncbi:MAG: site-specific integrase [Nitrospirota bacterium]
MNGMRSFDGNVKRATERVQNDGQLCEENRKLILDFTEKCFADGLSKGRICKILYTVRYLGGYVKKPFPEATKLDIQNVVAQIERQDRYSEWTKYDFKVILKKFYKWLKGKDETYPDEVRWIKPKIKNGKKMLPDNLVTEDEVKLIAEATLHPRDKAFIMTLYESGCRIGEILSLELKNVQFDEFGAVLRVSGKTGDRRVRVVSSAPLLASWLDVHPDRSNPEAPLWAGRFKKYSRDSFTYQTAMRMLKENALKAGVKRRIYPHLFRHSRATALASRLTEAQMKEHFGWVQSSDMASVYVHLSGRDVDEALLKTYGIKTGEEKKEEKFKPKNCPRCKTPGSPISKFCNRCGTVLDAGTVYEMENEREKADNLLNELMKNPEFKEYMLRKVNELGLGQGITQ